MAVKHASRVASLATLLALPLAVYVVFRLSLIPSAVQLSLTNMAYVGRRAWDWSLVGLANYRDLLLDSRFRESLRNSFFYAVGAGLVGQFWLGFLLAMLVWEARLKGGARGRLGALLTGVAIVSWIMPETVAGLEWMAMFDKYNGMLNAFLSWFGIPPREWLDLRSGWLGIPTALYALMLANIWKGAAFGMVLFSTAMEGIPRSIYEAARLDGLSRVQEWMYITLPLLRHMLPFAFLILFSGSFNQFGLVWLLAGQVWHEANVAIYSWAVAFRQYEVGYGSAIAVLLALLYLLLGVAQRRLRSEPQLVLER